MQDKKICLHFRHPISLPTMTKTSVRCGPRRLSKSQQDLKRSKATTDSSSEEDLPQSQTSSRTYASKKVTTKNKSKEPEVTYTEVVEYDYDSQSGSDDSESESSDDEVHLIVQSVVTAPDVSSLVKSLSQTVSSVCLHFEQEFEQFAKDKASIAEQLTQLIERVSTYAYSLPNDGRRQSERTKKNNAHMVARVAVKQLCTKFGLLTQHLAPSREEKSGPLVDSEDDYSSLTEFTDSEDAFSSSKSSLESSSDSCSEGDGAMDSDCTEDGLLLEPEPEPAPVPPKRTQATRRSTATSKKNSKRKPSAESTVTKRSAFAQMEQVSVGSVVELDTDPFYYNRSKASIRWMLSSVDEFESAMVEKKIVQDDIQGDELVEPEVVEENLDEDYLATEKLQNLVTNNSKFKPCLVAEVPVEAEEEFVFNFNEIEAFLIDALDHANSTIDFEFIDDTCDIIIERPIEIIEEVENFNEEVEGDGSDFVCFTCSKSIVGDQILSCDGFCDHHFHPVCVGISEDQLESLVTYFCDDCQASMAM
ncbi:hypothetical protein RCL1_004783 [Eukaryota sp. TZLM3-RCL]